MIERAIIKSISGVQATVELANGEQIEMSFLLPAVGSKYIHALPAVGTVVVCLISDGFNCILGAIYSDENKPTVADKSIELKAENLSFSLNGSTSKVSLKNAQISFKDALNGLIDTIDALTTVTPSGTGLVSPTSKLALTNNKTQINLILE